MRWLIHGVSLFVIACSDPAPKVMLVPDVPIDAGPTSINGCQTGPGPAMCGATMAPVVTPTDTPCDPLTQAECAADQKCTSLGRDRIRCVPDGAIGLGCPCTISQTVGYDDCARGSMCMNGVCEAICGLSGAAPTCATGANCVPYQYSFSVGGSPIAGLCDPTCDPLTQCMAPSPDPDACGAADPTLPDRGCFGYAAFACGFAPGRTTATDRQPPVNPGINGCAAGFIPLFFEQTGSTTVLCTGLCAVLETDNTPAHAGNGKGDPTARGKLPTDLMPVVGNATCEPTKKGSEASSQCRFLWPYLTTEASSSPSFAPYLDSLGVCLAIAHFQYDSNGDTMPDLPYPDCATLPPRSASTPGEFDDAADWLCQKRSTSLPFGSARPGGAMRDVRIGGLESVPRVRHALQ